MKSKKIILIIILIAFIAFIVMILANADSAVGKVSNTEQQGNLEKTTNNSTNNATSSNSVTTADSINKEKTVRKSTEKVEASTDNIVEITDNFFIQQTNDVYFNLNDYLGKTIKMQGLIYSYEDTNGDICYAVVRNTPGCCGADGLAGLDIRCSEEYPKVETWVEVVGVVGIDTVYGDKIPAIQVTSLKETEEGKTFVTN